MRDRVFLFIYFWRRWIHYQSTNHFGIITKKKTEYFFFFFVSHFEEKTIYYLNSTLAILVDVSSLDYVVLSALLLLLVVALLSLLPIHSNAPCLYANIRHMQQFLFVFCTSNANTNYTLIVSAIRRDCFFVIQIDNRCQSINTFYQHIVVFKKKIYEFPYLEIWSNYSVRNHHWNWITFTHKFWEECSSIVGTYARWFIENRWVFPINTTSQTINSEYKC